jgi:hypothetical protein
MSKKSPHLPGVSFSWRRALGITGVKQKISRATGVPMTKNGLERKIGSTIIKMLTKGLNKKKTNRKCYLEKQEF